MGKYVIYRYEKCFPNPPFLLNSDRHLLSGGYFRQVDIFNEKDDNTHANEANAERSPWLHVMARSDVDKLRWRCAGPATG